eukprot:TRINITY_DN1746_c0_g1_i2.p1 TRINITY_DN1746_c0_g1~~TRINITY_DN1746_c0_g1_i2.p1  ORF type:complete len:217 (+),score=20.27 TRINITY_DN1746_c0_g1_i2:918-1568(+)
MSSVMTPLSYHTIEEKYLDQVKTLHDHLFPIKYADSFYRSLISDELYEVVVGVDEGDEVVSVATGRMQFAFKQSPAAYVSTFGVRESYRRCGLGVEILKRLVVQLWRRDCLMIYLHVQASNVAAVNFYVKCGFRKMKYLRNYYNIVGELNDAYEMLLILPDSIMEERTIDELYFIMQPVPESEHKMNVEGPFDLVLLCAIGLIIFFALLLFKILQH